MGKTREAPTRPSERVDSRIDDLVAAYAAADTALSSALGAVIAGGAIEASLSRVVEILDDLLATALEWIESVFPQIYGSGIRSALESLGLPSDSVDTSSHDEALDSFLDDLTESLAAANENISRDARAAIREASRANLAAEISVGNTDENAKRMSEHLREERGVSFTDKSGRSWNLETYSRTVLTTHAVSARNYATGLVAAEIGSPGIRIRDALSGLDADEPCKRADGQAWSTTYFLSHPLQHPNCTREGTPLPVGWRGELDRE